MKRKEIANLLIILNSSGNFDKYPFGNVELTSKVKRAELLGFIKYNGFKWI